MEKKIETNPKNKLERIQNLRFLLDFFFRKTKCTVNKHRGFAFWPHFTRYYHIFLLRVKVLFSPVHY